MTVAKSYSVNIIKLESPSSSTLKKTMFVVGNRTDFLRLHPQSATCVVMDTISLQMQGLTMQQRDQLREVTSNFGRVNVLIEPKPLVTFKVCCSALQSLRDFI